MLGSRIHFINITSTTWLIALTLSLYNSRPGFCCFIYASHCCWLSIRRLSYICTTRISQSIPCDKEKLNHSSAPKPICRAPNWNNKLPIMYSLSAPSLYSSRDDSELGARSGAFLLRQPTVFVLSASVWDFKVLHTFLSVFALA